MIPHIAFPAITWAALEAELARELQQRRALYPKRVETGRMLQAEASGETAIAMAWAEDLARMRARWLSPAPRGAFPFPHPSHPITWAARRRSLLRELGMRQRFYPEWIAAGRLLADQATHQLACLQCLLTIYEDGWDWRASDGLLPSQSQIAAAEYAALQTEAVARNGTAQKELAL